MGKIITEAVRLE